LDKGQEIAAQLFGLEPRTWGVIAAVASVAVAIVVLRGRRPSWLAPGDPIADPAAAHPRAWLLLAVVLVAAAHFRGFFGSFNLWLDYAQIVNDKHINAVTWKKVYFLLTHNYRGGNQELFYLSLMLNWWISHQYWVWYGVNLAILLLACGLVDRLAVQLVGSRTAAIAALLLFGLSPATGEAVCWMSDRDHLLGLPFALGSVSAYISYVRTPAGSATRRRWFAGSVIAFVLSQLVRPVFLFVPVWLVLFDLYEGRRDWKRMALEKIPHGILAVAFLIKVLAGAGTRLSSGGPLGGNYVNTLLMDLNLLVEYLRALVVPYETGMNPGWNEATGPFHVEGIPQILPFGFLPICSLAIVSSVAAIAVALDRRFQWKLPLFVLGCVLAALAPVMNIPYRGPFAVFEYRYLLTSHAIVSILMADALRRLAGTRLSPVGWGRYLPPAIFAAYLAAEGVVLNREIRAWHDSSTYWVRNVVLYPYTYNSYLKAGVALLNDRRYQDAIAMLENAERIGPPNARFAKPLADALWQVGRKDEAAHYYLEHVATSRKVPSATVRARLEEMGVDSDAIVAAKQKYRDLAQ
jgi:hypothetical protein